MCDKKTVYRLYFYEKKKVVEIAEELSVTKQAISKILKQFPEYLIEKKERKEKNKIKHNKQIAEYIKKKRQEEREEEEALLANLKKLQEKHCILILSRKNKFSERAIVETCINHYEYDKEHERLVFKEDFGKRPADLPKTMKVHKNVLSQFINYSQQLENEKWTSTTERKALK